MSEGLFLNLGCGGQTPPNWINVDRAGDVDLVLDLTEPWPWDRRSVDGIAMHHVLDLFDDDEYWHVLDEAHRVLKLGAVLRISLADINKAVVKAMNQEWDWFPEPKYVGRSDGHLREDDMFNGEQTLGWFITQGGARRQFLDVHELVETLNSYFAHASRSSFKFTNGPPQMAELDARDAESIYVEAIR